MYSDGGFEIWRVGGLVYLWGFLGEDVGGRVGVGVGFYRGELEVNFDFVDCVFRFWRCGVVGY